MNLLLSLLLMQSHSISQSVSISHAYIVYISFCRFSGTQRQDGILLRRVRSSNGKYASSSRDRKWLGKGTSELFFLLFLSDSVWKHSSLASIGVRPSIWPNKFGCLTSPLLLLCP